MKKPLIILTGPTAVGKTRLSLDLCKAVNGCVISADSVQVYKEMNIGSAKIMPEEMEGIPHYLIDVLSPKDEFNVSLFVEMAHEAMDEIYAMGKIPVVTGGTGFYVQALLREIDFTSASGALPLRKELEDVALTEEGRQRLFERLRQIDPESCEIIHPNNVKRVIRAIEFYEETGEKISEHNKSEHERTSPYNFAYYVLTDERSVLYDRINLRVDKMMADGLLSEVKTLKEEGLCPGMTAYQALGYKEFFPYLEGTCTLEEAVDRLKTDTRHFAKRQLTWFRREKDVTWLDKSLFDRDDQKILQYILADLAEKGIIEKDEENSKS